MVLHLAAAVGVNLIVERLLESLATNIRGSEIVLEKCRKAGRKVLITSTSEIYGKNTSGRALSEEDDRILGSPKTRWSYSEGRKAIEEALAHAYWRQKACPPSSCGCSPWARGRSGTTAWSFPASSIRAPGDADHLRHARRQPDPDASPRHGRHRCPDGTTSTSPTPRGACSNVGAQDGRSP